MFEKEVAMRSVFYVTYRERWTWYILTRYSGMQTCAWGPTRLSFQTMNSYSYIVSSVGSNIEKRNEGLPSWD